MKSLLITGLLSLLVFSLSGCSSSTPSPTPKSATPSTPTPIEAAYSIKPEASNEKANTYVKVTSNNTMDSTIDLEVYIDNDLYIKEILSPKSQAVINYAYDVTPGKHTLKINVNGEDKFHMPLDTSTTHQTIDVNYDSGNSVTDATATVSYSDK